MKMMKKFSKKLILWIVWFFEGIVVGFGAILPGVSGGTLCVTFGMYRPIIEILNSPKKNIRKYAFMLGLFLMGAAVGFIGLSGLAAWLLEKNTTFVICAFIGLIIGTFPELWQEAGKEKRGKASYIAMLLCFIAMLIILRAFKSDISLIINPGIFGYVLCGLLWGLSFIVPGLSSSSLLLFFGLYQPMLEGISSFDMGVIIPMACGMGVCILLLSKAAGYAYQKYYSIMSHGVIGIVAATTVMIFPPFSNGIRAIMLNTVFIIGGAVVSYLLTCGCKKLKENTSE